ncbi:MAG TPA: hypothetical protein VLD84_05990 [Nitrososphaeraceae archaeon]|nr:hypothetical protein [Nitrososphaeraceae archaeon]
MSKFTHADKSSIQNVVATLSIERIPDAMIIKHVENTTGRAITRKTTLTKKKML